MTVVRRASWPTLEAKAQWLDAAASIDAHRSGVGALARRLALGSGAGSLVDATPVVQAAFLFWRDAIRYTRDRTIETGQRAEQFADADTVISRGYDDCDGKARGFVATLRAIAQLGVPVVARIVPIFSASFDDFKHVQAEARWLGSETFPLVGADGWVLAELTLKGVPLGAGVEAARYTDGRPDVT